MTLVTCPHRPVDERGDPRVDRIALPQEVVLVARSGPSHAWLVGVGLSLQFTSMPYTVTELPRISLDEVAVERQDGCSGWCARSGGVGPGAG